MQYSWGSWWIGKVGSLHGDSWTHSYRDYAFVTEFGVGIPEQGRCLHNPCNTVGIDDQNFLLLVCQILLSGVVLNSILVPTHEITEVRGGIEFSFKKCSFHPTSSTRLVYLWLLTHVSPCTGLCWLPWRRCLCGVLRDKWWRFSFSPLHKCGTVSSGIIPLCAWSICCTCFSSCWPLWSPAFYF